MFGQRHSFQLLFKENGDRILVKEEMRRIGSQRLSFYGFGNHVEFSEIQKRARIGPVKSGKAAFDLCFVILTGVLKLRINLQAVEKG